MDEYARQYGETMPQTTIVPMEEPDLPEVLSIEASSRQTSWSRQSFVEEMKGPLSFSFVLKGRLESTEQVLGFICFRLIGEESELLNLAVHCNYRRRGLGRQLMKFYLDFCRKRNAKVFYLETAVSNEAAIRLYRSFDYRPAGTRPQFYRAKDDALLMVRRA